MEKEFQFLDGALVIVVEENEFLVELILDKFCCYPFEKDFTALKHGTHD
jgi:hypothetical protein